VTDLPHRSDDYCYLTTKGRRSRRPHRIEIWYAAHGATLYLLSGGGRASDWVQNISADPAVLVEVDGRTRPARARIVDADDEVKRARSLVFAKYDPRSDQDLAGWRDRALPVAIDLPPGDQFP